MSHPDALPDLFLDRSLGRIKVPELLRDAGLRLVTLAEHYGVPADEAVVDEEWLEFAGTSGEANAAAAAEPPEGASLPVPGIATPSTDAAQIRRYTVGDGVRRVLVRFARVRWRYGVGAAATTAYMVRFIENRSWRAAWWIVDTNRSRSAGAS